MGRVPTPRQDVELQDPQRDRRLGSQGVVSATSPQCKIRLNTIGYELRAGGYCESRSAKTDLDAEPGSAAARDRLVVARRRTAVAKQELQDLQ